MRITRVNGGVLFLAHRSDSLEPFRYHAMKTTFCFSLSALLTRILPQRDPGHVNDHVYSPVP
jgi:hypothetical protein